MLHGQNVLEQKKITQSLKISPEVIYTFLYNKTITTMRITIMAAYTCNVCGMSIGTMTCGKCGKELVHSTITTDDGETVHVSECPDGHGKVKSPMCCGQDMEAK